MVTAVLSATWISASSMVEGVIYPGYAWVGSQNRVYVASGLNDPLLITYSTLTQIYDPVTDSWNTGGTVLSPMWVLAGAYVGDTFYVFGGEDPNTASYSNTNRKYNVPASLWSYGPSLPDGRAGLGAAGFGGKIYLAGGYSNCGLFTCTVYNTTWEYDLSTGTYTTKSNLPTTLAEGVLITSEPFAGIGLFYVSGYTSVSFGVPTLSSTIYRYDPLSDSWVSVGNYPAPARYQLGAVFLPDTSIWVIDGADAGGNVYANVDRCKLNAPLTACDWTSYDPPDLPAGRDALVVTLADTTPPRPDSLPVDTVSCLIKVDSAFVTARRRILVAGGSDGSSPQATAWTLVPDTLQVVYYLSNALSTRTSVYVHTPSSGTGYFGPIADTFIVPTGDTACLDSVLFYEKETGFRYVSRPGICVSCVPTGSEGELGVGERKSKSQEPFILIGRTLVPQTYVEVFSPDGRTVYRGKGSTLLKPGVYFVRSRDKITRVMVR